MSTLVILAIIAAVITIIIVGSIQQRKRREALQRLAASLQGRFDPSKARHFEDSYPQFAIFSTGSSRYAYNRVLATTEINGARWEFEAGDYHYTTTSGSGDDRRTHTHNFSFLILHLPFPRGCELSIRKEGLVDKFAGFMGFDDIDFESEEFSAEFHVKGANKRLVYDIVDARMMDFLLASDPPKIDVDGGACCLVDHHERIWQPDQFAMRIRWAQDFFGRWPAHVVATLQSGGA